MSTLVVGELKGFLLAAEWDDNHGGDIQAQVFHLAHQDTVFDVELPDLPEQ